MKKHLGSSELQKAASLFEEKCYSTATCKADYMRKIAVKLLSMGETSESIFGAGFPSRNLSAEDQNHAAPGQLIMPDTTRQVLEMQHQHQFQQQQNSQNPLIYQHHGQQFLSNQSIPHPLQIQQQQSLLTPSSSQDNSQHDHLNSVQPSCLSSRVHQYQVLRARQQYMNQLGRQNNLIDIQYQQHVFGEQVLNFDAQNNILEQQYHQLSESKLSISNMQLNQQSVHMFQRSLRPEIESQPLQLTMQQRSNPSQSDIQVQHQASSSSLYSRAIEQQIEPFEVSSAVLVESQDNTTDEDMDKTQEELYQKIKSMKAKYIGQLAELHIKISRRVKEMCNEPPPSGRKSDHYKVLKSRKRSIEKLIKLLQSSKGNIPVDMKEKLPKYEEWIVNFLGSHRRRRRKIVPSQSQVQNDQNYRQMQQPMPQLPGQFNVGQGSGIKLSPDEQNHSPTLGTSQISSPQTSLSPSSILCDANFAHQKSPLASTLAQSPVVISAGIPASALLAECTSPEASQANVSEPLPDDLNSTERPIARLIRVVQSLSPEILRSGLNDIASVVRMNDSLACPTPGNNSRSVIGEDLASTTRCRSQVQRLISEGENSRMKMKRQTTSMPLDELPLSGIIKESCKKQKTEVNNFLQEEIRSINHGLINMELDIVENGDEFISATKVGKGTVIKCSFRPVSFSPDLKSLLSSVSSVQVTPLRLLLPPNYPDTLPIVLDELPAELNEETEDLSLTAKSRLNRYLCNITYPMTLTDMVNAWDVSVCVAIAEFAKKFGGGCISST
ncbi:uncharacterized protein A4U43_C04F2960 [Asparagus officinalis]|uniref:Uncharacterized protein n=1 Tax=Asparagus officinalis TaxID=4686 RepID=A0A5P1EXS9_ASPOF|nr:uncharacterized protein A4U43_C04F2960 [Asparagus officinalis]